MRSLAKVTTFSFVLLVLAACGGSGGSADDSDGGDGLADGGVLDDASGGPDAAGVTGGSQVTISGALSGLEPNGSITITDNASDPLTLTANGNFTFKNKVAVNKTYSVTVTTPPENQTCQVTAATGTVTNAVTNVAVSCTTIAPKSFLLAGRGGAPGTVDGTGPTARFNAPAAITTDATGNVYVADTGNHTIRKITAAGVVTTLAGEAGIAGSSDGNGAAAHFTSPTGIAVDAANNVYVSDTGNFTIRAITPAGAVTTIGGTAGQSGNVNASGTAARFAKPLGLFTTGGLLLIADRDNAAVRQLTIGGASPAIITYQSGLTTPVAVALDPVSGKYAEVSDTAQIVFEIGGGTLAGGSSQPGFVNAQGTAARFHDPSAIAFGATAAYVADPTNNAVRIINLANGQVGTIAGTGTAGALDGGSASALLNGPKGVAVDSNGVVYIADTGNNVIRKVVGSTVSTFAGSLPSPGSVDGTGVAARFTNPFGVATDATGNVFVADSVNHTIRKIAPGGVVTTFAGMVGVPGKVNDTGTAASFYGPFALAFDKTGNLYVADELNCAIRKVTSAGVVSSLVDPGGCPVAAGDTLVRFKPRGVAVDSMGNVFFTDSWGNAIWKATPAGVATPFVGGTQGNADGKGLGANFNFVSQLAIDASDNLYLADTGNSAVRKITPAGDITTVTFPANVVMNSPFGVAIDKVGTLFVSDQILGFVAARKSDGTASIVLGAPKQFGLQVGTPPGFMNGPGGVAIFGTTVYVTDYTENAIIQVTNLAY